MGLISRVSSRTYRSLGSNFLKKKNFPIPVMAQKVNQQIRHSSRFDLQHSYISDIGRSEKRGQKSISRKRQEHCYLFNDDGERLSFSDCESNRYFTIAPFNSTPILDLLPKNNNKSKSSKETITLDQTNNPIINNMPH